MTENDINPEQENTTPETDSSTQSQTGERQLSRKAMLIITGIALALVLVGYFLLTSGGDDSTEETIQDPPPVATTPSSSPTVIATAETTPDSNITEGSTIDPEGESHREHGPLPYDENGTEYIMLPESQAEWRPLRARFIQGLIGEGDIASAVEGTATDEVMAALENQRPGAFHDSIPEDLDIHDQYDERVSGYEYTEAIRMESGRWLFVTISSTNVNEEETFRVSSFEIRDDGQPWEEHDHDHGEGG